jgi:hypothetical protein
MASFVPFNQELNRLTLIVKDLPAERAKVTWGKASKVFARADLGKGINLAAEFPDNPFAEMFAKVDAAVAAKQAHETYMVKQGMPAIRGLQKTLEGDKEVDAAGASLLKKLLDKETGLSDAARAAVTPVRHTIVIETATE